MEQSTENIAAIATCDIFLYVAKVVHNMSTVARSIAYNINYMLLGHWMWDASEKSATVHLFQFSSNDKIMQAEILDY